MSIIRVCVYCGSSGAVGEPYRDAARDSASALARAAVEIVFGGGGSG